MTAGLFLGSTVYAQTPSQTLNQTAPRAERSDRTPLPGQTTPNGATPGATAEMGRMFKLEGVGVSGSSVFSGDQLSRHYADKVGHDVSVGDMGGVAMAIRNMYRDAGYMFTRVTVEPISSGASSQVSIVVHEAMIGSVTIEEPNGSVGPVRKLLERMAGRVAGLKNPTLAELERVLLLMNDVPGITRATAVPRAGQDSGVVDLFINVERDKFSGAVFADNRQSPVIGEGAGGVQLNFDAYTSGADSTQLTYINSFGTEFDDLEERHLGQIMHRRNFGSKGLTGTARLLYGRTKPGDALGPVDIEGEQLEAEIQLEYPIKRTRKLSLWVNGGFEFRNTETDILNGAALLSDDRLRIAYIGARFLQRDKRGYTEGSVQIRQGLNILDASDDKSQPLSRFDGEVDFTTVRVELARELGIYRGLSAYWEGAGQYSRGPLLSSEEFAIGGGTFGRGFDPSESTGDYGVGMKAELRYSGDFTIKGHPSSYQVYGFADYGKVWQADDGQPDNADLFSGGAGVRLNLPKQISLVGEVAVPFEELKRTNDRDVKFLFNIVKRF
jgi:hemolysin activation/secretion protein